MTSHLCNRPSSRLAILACMLHLSLGDALAQSDANVPSAALEEVTVTARKREESLVDVPLAISAISEQLIERTGIDTVADLATQTPGLTMHQGFGRAGAGQGGGSSNRPTLRGQSNILGVPNVGFFVDGVYVSGNVTSYPLDNLERVEVIRGPQSALFGRGTFAGAVNFITRKPNDELRGKLEGTIGQRDHYEVTGFVSGPLIEGKLAGEINARFYDFAGDWYNRATGRRDGGAQRSTNVGGRLRFTPTDALDLGVKVAWAEDLDGFYPASYSGTNCLQPTIVQGGTVPRSSTRRTGYFCGEVKIDDSFFSRSDILEAAGLDGVDRRTFRSSIDAEYSFGDWTLSGVAAYNRFQNANASDRTFEQAELTLRPTGLTAAEDSRKDWSFEARLASPADRRLKGLLGVYRYAEDDGSGYRVTFALPASGPVPIGAGTVVVTRTPERNDSAVRNWSAFGSLEFDFTDRLVGSIEGRYQVDEIISDQLPLVSTNVLLEESFEEFLPRATMLFRATEQWNVYANVALGNKPGGFNALPDDANAASAAALSRFQTYDEERAWTYELGVKGANSTRTLSLSAAIYWIDWTKQQLTRTESYTRVNGTTFARSLIQNAGESRIRGFELDLSARPIESLELRLGYSLTDAKIENFVDEVQEDLFDTDGRVGIFNTGNDPTGQTAGNRLPQTPVHQVVLSADYSRALTDRWRGFVRTDTNYESKRYDQVHNLAWAGDSYLTNLRLGAETDAISLTLFVNNLFDDRTPMVVSRFVDFTRSIQIPSNLNPAQTQTVTLRDMLAAHPRKRTIGVTATYRF